MDTISGLNERSLEEYSYQNILSNPFFKSAVNVRLSWRRPRGRL